MGDNVADFEYVADFEHLRLADADVAGSKGAVPVKMGRGRLGEIVGGGSGGVEPAQQRGQSNTHRVSTIGGWCR